MPQPARYLDLRCPQCRWRQTCGPAEIARWLTAARKLRANRMPELDILYELFRAAGPTFACPQCGHVGLGVSNSIDDAHAWPGTPGCAACGRPIPRERLEAVPNARLCAACQALKDTGRPREETQYCPRCGSPLEVRLVGAPDHPRYVLACSARPPCPL
jgi:DNA-directed RNA polymerase subunit RPC12/RpoP